MNSMFSRDLFYKFNHRRAVSSRHGFDPGARRHTETIAEIRGWSKTVMEECGVGAHPDHFPVAQGGIWAEAVRERKPIIVNDYSKPHSAMRGYSEGHMELTRFMSVPIFDRNRIVALSLLANKDEGYNPSDARRVALLINGMWRVIQHKRAEREKLLYTKRLELRNKELQDFAFIASHDLQEPLRKIQVFGNRLMRGHEASVDSYTRDSVTSTVKRKVLRKAATLSAWKITE
jgi:GAF domain-containing protein